MLKFINPVIAVAHEDYDDTLVAINAAAIAECPKEGERSAMGATLPQDSLALAMEGIPYFIAMTAINFQFWEVNDAGEFLRYKHNGIEGALAMQAAFRDVWADATRVALETSKVANNVRLVAEILADRFAREGLTGAFGDSIPALGERSAIMREVLGVDTEFGEQLYRASVILLNAMLVKHELTWDHAEFLAQTFPVAYGDRYLKKAQLALMFIAGQWNERNPLQPVKLKVTVAADYQLPRILRAMGILSYAPSLAAKIDAQHLIEADSREERAIRAATVLACEALAKHLDCSLPQVDFWLWTNRNKAKDARFHLTRTTAY